MDREKSNQIYIANLPYDTREKELKYKFEKFGDIKNLSLKVGYAFIVSIFSTIILYILILLYLNLYLIFLFY